MQGNTNGLCTKIKNYFATYVIGIHCMAHRMNLAFGVVSSNAEVEKVDTLIKEVYQYFCRSHKQFRKFKVFSNGLISVNKLLKDNDTRWISLDGPVHHLLLEYPSLLGLIYSNKDKLGNLKYLVPHSKLIDLETLLTLVAILPILEEMRDIMKKAQQRAMFIVE